MFKQIGKQKGLEILEYGLIAALIIGGGVAAYLTLSKSAGNNATTVNTCITNPGNAACKAPT